MSKIVNMVEAIGVLYFSKPFPTLLLFSATAPSLCAAYFFESMATVTMGITNNTNNIHKSVCHMRNNNKLVLIG